MKEIHAICHDFLGVKTIVAYDRKWYLENVESMHIFVCLSTQVVV